MVTKIRERAADPLLRQELLCKEASSRNLAEAIACAIFISQGERLHYVNHAAETITGYSREELLSMNFWDLVHPDSRELVLNRGGARQGDARQYEVKILTKNGDERWLDSRNSWRRTPDADRRFRKWQKGLRAATLTLRSYGKLKCQTLIAQTPF